VFMGSPGKIPIPDAGLFVSREEKAWTAKRHARLFMNDALCWPLRLLFGSRDMREDDQRAYALVLRNSPVTGTTLYCSNSERGGRRNLSSRSWDAVLPPLNARATLYLRYLQFSRVC